MTKTEIERLSLVSKLLHLTLKKSNMPNDLADFIVEKAVNILDKIIKE